MNVNEGRELLQIYRNVPKNFVFAMEIINYPLFHLLERFTKNDWVIEYNCIGRPALNVDQFPAEELSNSITHNGYSNIYQYVARKPGLRKTMLAYVQEDLYCRYVGRCTPLRASHTTWTFIPLEKVINNRTFQGYIGRNTNLYLLEIDLDIVDIIGKWNDDIPWHYLQQTIDWKPFTDRIPWQDNLNSDEPPVRVPIQVNRYRGPRIMVNADNPRMNVRDNPANPDVQMVRGIEDVRRQSHQNAREAFNNAFIERESRQEIGEYERARQILHQRYNQAILADVREADDEVNE